MPVSVDVESAVHATIQQYGIETSELRFELNMERSKVAAYEKQNAELAERVETLERMVQLTAPNDDEDEPDVEWATEPPTEPMILAPADPLDEVPEG